MRLSAALLLSLLLTGPLHAERIVIPTAHGERPILKSIYSGEHQLSDFKKRGANAIALVFLGIECPVSAQYVPVLRSIHEQFASQQVQLLGIYSDAGVNLLEMARHAHDNDIPFPVLMDVGHRLADIMGVSSVPEVVVLDANFEKRYQGAIDDQFKKRGRLAAPSHRYLTEALAHMVAGEPVEVSYMPASGCPLERGKNAQVDKELTFYKDVAPLIQQNCETCHRSGGVAPFELKSYDDVAGNAEKIKEVVLERRMPPWHGFVNPQFGKMLNDKSLPEESVKKIVTWIDSGVAAGNSKDGPKPVRWPSPADWSIGTPDYVYKIDQPFRVPKSGFIEYQFFRVKLNNDHDRWFQRVEVKPGNAEVVHHIGLHIVEASSKNFSGFAGMAALYGLSTERARLINDYLPGDTYNAKVYPADQAVRIPKHSDLIYEIHYTPNNREATTDQSMVAFKWADAPPEHEVHTTVFRKAIGRFRIPPYDYHHHVEDTYHFEEDIELDAVRPHFHLRGKSYRLEMIERNSETDEVEKRTTILAVPVWDQAWQRTYEFATPLRIPAGTELLATGYFDNSELNPNNPDPSAVVEWGQQTNDEMFSTRFKYRVIKTAHPQQVVHP